MSDEHSKTPACVGVIIDGNRRWAKQRGLPSLEGHRVGYKKIKDFLAWAREAGVKHVIAYVFSSENWNRSEEEVSYLMKLIKMVFEGDLKEFKKEGTRIRVIGDRIRPAKDILALIEKTEEETKHFTEFTLTLAFSYGGRDEITDAVNRVLKDGREPGSITKEEFSSYLWTAGIPDPDIIIRTSGEMRLSNFLPWQSAYSELFFPNIFWPDFTKEDFLQILKEFAERNRRFGK